MDCIDHEVGEHLPQFTRKAPHGTQRVEARGDGNAAHADLRSQQREHTLHDLGEVNRDRRLGLAMKRQELSGDLSDAPQFLAGQVEIAPGLGIWVGFVTQQENPIYNGLRLRKRQYQFENGPLWERVQPNYCFVSGHVSRDDVGNVPFGVGLLEFSNVRTTDKLNVWYR